MTTTTLHVQITGDESPTLADEAWRSAAECVRERTYGETRVRWTSPFELQIDGDASYADRYFCDLFLILNLAMPGSFSGSITLLPGGEELTLSARVFEYAKPRTLPLRDVVAWFDTLVLGDIARAGVTKALYLLLHLARREEDETVAVVRLAQALEAMNVALPPDVREVRDAIVHGTAPVVHPLADEDEETLRVLDAADAAASAVIAELQRRIERK